MILVTGATGQLGTAVVKNLLEKISANRIAAFVRDGGCGNRIYKLTGSESYSFDDVAATLSDLSGKEVDYTPAEKSAFEAQMKERSVPETMVQRVVGFLTDIKNGQEEEVSPDMENLLGRKPASLKEGLKVLFNL